MNVQYDAYVMYSANSMLLCSCLGSSMSRCIHGSGCVGCDIRADAGVCVSGEVVGFGGNGEEEASVEEEEEDEEDEFSIRSGGDDKEGHLFEKEETRSLFTNYSISSSVLPRNEGLTKIGRFLFALLIGYFKFDYCSQMNSLKLCLKKNMVMIWIWEP